MATYKQQLVAQKLVENGGNIGKAMVAAGYSKATAKTPKKLTESLGWKELMKEQFIPDEELLKRHHELLYAETPGHFTFPKSTTDGEIKDLFEKVPDYTLITIERNSQCAKANFSRPDNATQLKSIVLAYKLLGLLGRDHNKADDEEDQVSQEMREAVFRIRKILPASES